MFSVVPSVDVFAPAFLVAPPVGAFTPAFLVVPTPNPVASVGCLLTLVYTLVVCALVHIPSK